MVTHNGDSKGIGLVFAMSKADKSGDEDDETIKIDIWESISWYMVNLRK